MWISYGWGGSKTDAPKEERGTEINPKYSFFFPDFKIFSKKIRQSSLFSFSSLPTTTLLPLTLFVLDPVLTFFSSSKSKKNQHF